jgi:cell division protein FtsQ
MLARAIVKAGESHDPCSGVAIKSSNRNRSLVWEDEVPVEPRFRRVQQSVPLSGRGLPGMPLEMEDPEGDDSPAYRKRLFDEPPRPWWRPASTWGRVFLGAGVLLIVSIFGVSANLVRNFLERDARFRIMGTGNIQATGLGEVSRAEMLPVFGEDIGRNIFFVPLAERRQQLERIPWVQRATVMRLLPDQIRVSVVERQPVAFVRHGQQIGLVDASGVLLDMPPAMMARHHYSFPVLTGIDAGDPLPSRKARMTVYQRLVAELDANGQHLSDQISEVDLTDPEDARVLIPEQGADILAHFGQDHFLARYQRYKAHIAEWRQQYPKLAEVDLRFDQQVVLEMAPGTASSPAAASATDAKPAAGEPVKSPVEANKAPIATSKPVVSHKAAKTHPKANARESAKTRESAKARESAKTRAARLRAKKRAEAMRAALNEVRQQRLAAKNRQAAAAGQAQ